MDAPKVVGQTEPLDEIVRSDARSDHDALVAIGETGIRIAEVGDPRAMRLVLGEGNRMRLVYTLAVRGDPAIVGNPGGMSILEASDPPHGAVGCMTDPFAPVRKRVHSWL